MTDNNTAANALAASLSVSTINNEPMEHAQTVNFANNPIYIPLPAPTPEKEAPKPEKEALKPEKEALKPKNNKPRYSSSDSDTSVASESDEEQIPKKKLRRNNFKELEAEIDYDLFSESDDETKKKPEPQEKQKICRTSGCVLLAVKHRKHCSGCGRLIREKKARALRREAKRLLEMEYELHHKYQRQLLKKNQQAQRDRLEKKKEAIKRKFSKK